MNDINGDDKNLSKKKNNAALFSQLNPILSHIYIYAPRKKLEEFSNSKTNLKKYIQPVV